MKATGGYFEMEKIAGSSGRHYHGTPYRFDCGRSALEVILKKARPSKIHLPFYTCDALLQPLQKLRIPYSYYAVDEKLECTGMAGLKKGEYIIYINYFCVKDAYCKQLVKLYGNRLILDNTMAYFFRHASPHWGFNSCRKFFGLPDGSYLQAPVPMPKTLLASSANPGLDLNFLYLRSEGYVQQGYASFLKNEEAFGQSVFAMSNYSQDALATLSHTSAKEKRIKNFSFWQKQLSHLNTLQLPVNKDAAMFYPYLPAKPIPHKLFWGNNIFLPRLWADCLHRPENFDWEKKLASELLPLPVDHRYGQADLEKILKLIFRGK